MFDHVIQVLTVIVGSGLLAAIYKNYSELKIQNQMRLNEVVENRFRSILIYMDVILNPDHIIFIEDDDKGKFFTKNITAETAKEIQKHYQAKTRANLLNLYLYTDRELIEELESFLDDPSAESYKKVAIKMRDILWKQ